MIDGFLERDEDIPVRFLEHMKRCTECHFWLPYRLAIQKASNTVPRNYYDNGCPAKIEFERLLKSAATCIIAGHGLKPKNTRELEGLETGDPRLLRETISHLQRCWPCMDYYRLLHDAMIAEQKNIQATIKRGENIRPVFLDTASERAVRGIHLIDTHSEKPN